MAHASQEHKESYFDGVRLLTHKEEQPFYLVWSVEAFGEVYQRRVGVRDTRVRVLRLRLRFEARNLTVSLLLLLFAKRLALT